MSHWSAAIIDRWVTFSVQAESSEGQGPQPDPAARREGDLRSPQGAETGQTLQMYHHRSFELLTRKKKTMCLGELLSSYLNRSAEVPVDSKLPTDGQASFTGNWKRCKSSEKARWLSVSSKSQLLSAVQGGGGGFGSGPGTGGGGVFPELRSDTEKRMFRAAPRTADCCWNRSSPQSEASLRVLIHSVPHWDSLAPDELLSPKCRELGGTHRPWDDCCCSSTSRRSVHLRSL